MYSFQSTGLFVGSVYKSVCVSAPLHSETTMTREDNHSKDNHSLVVAMNVCLSVSLFVLIN